MLGTHSTMGVHIVRTSYYVYQKICEIFIFRFLTVCAYLKFTVLIELVMLISDVLEFISYL